MYIYIYIYIYIYTAQEGGGSPSARPMPATRDSIRSRKGSLT